MNDNCWEFRDFEKEFEEMDRECKLIFSHMDELFDWLGVLQDIQVEVARYNSNVTDLKAAFAVLDDNECRSPFLAGTLLVGVVSAYEAFIHGLFEACCNKTEFMNIAVANMGNLCDSDRAHLKLKKKETAVSLRNKLNRATLHDPLQMARLSMVLFRLAMPSLGTSETNLLLEIRNTFTHRNGIRSGKPVFLMKSGLLSVFNALDYLVNGYVETLLGKAELASQQEFPNAISERGITI